jgi:hypothetical protein
LQKAGSRFASQGLAFAALSYDHVETLRSFSERLKISYPLLADPGSEVIRRFQMVDPDNSGNNIPDYGSRDTAYPGWFLIDREGVVKERFLDPFWGDRYTANNVIDKLFPELKESSAPPQTAPHLSVRSTQSDTVGSPGSRISLSVEIAMAPGMHVYAPGAKGYRPVELLLDSSDVYDPRPINYPPSELLQLRAINEEAPVYRGKLQIGQDIVISVRRSLGAKLPDQRDRSLPVEITGKLHYQACDDKVCYRPTEVPLRWKLDLHRNDSKRSAASDRQRQ